MSHHKSAKNYTKILNSLYVPIPGLPRFPRAPDAHSNRDLVDVHIAKRRMQLAHLLPVIHMDAFCTSYIRESHEHAVLDRHLLATLLESGYTGVVDELVTLVKEEKSLFRSNTNTSGRTSSFAEDKALFEELIQGLVACADAEKSQQTTSEKYQMRKAIGEKMILRGDFWMARKMFAKCFDYLEFYDDSEMDRMRVELWCLLSYVCIYFEDSQHIGYDLPTKCLTVARQMSRDQPWHMQKSVMDVFIPKAINVYGLKNEWTKVKTDWINMYAVVTTLLHVLFVKKARYWQQELNCLIGMKCQDKCSSNWAEKQRQRLEDNIAEALTAAMAYADEVRLSSGFMAVTLRRGLFFEAQGEWEKAMEDFNAMHVLALNFDDREATAMAVNRMGQYHKLLGNAEMAIEKFAQEWEISAENEFEDLRADSLVDIGMILLEEGMTWEADECFSQSNEIFREMKQEDTPNDLDEYTWGLMGIARGQHMWGRFSTLIRSQETHKIKAIYNWKLQRKGFPLASYSPNWYKTQHRIEFEKQYEAALPKPHKKKRSSFKNPRHTKAVFFGERKSVDEERDNTRRLFEFAPHEVQNRPSTWFREKGYDNVFGFINASEKPRDVPRTNDGTAAAELRDLRHSIDAIEASGKDKHAAFTKHREDEAKRKTTLMANITRTSMKQHNSGPENTMGEWLSHDFRVKTWDQEKKGKSFDLSKWSDPNMGMGERLLALLDDMRDITNTHGHHQQQQDNRRSHELGMLVKFDSSKEEDDESDDTELRPETVKRRSIRSKSFLEAYASFEDKGVF